MDEPASLLSPLGLNACAKCAIRFGIVVGVGLGVSLVLILVGEHPYPMLLVLDAESLKPLVERHCGQTYLLGNDVGVP